MPQAILNYNNLLQSYPWIIERDQNCILSPDSDGLLCGLLMSHLLGWRIRGFYDGKILVVEDEISPSECVFLDMEIFRPNVRSIGQHMVLYDKNNLPPNWNHFQNSISANNLRSYDFKNDFKNKYPFGTVHLLLSILGQRFTIPIPKSAIGPLLYTDGAFKNQFNYHENCLSWLDFLNANHENNPLQKIFLDRHFSTYELMLELKELFSVLHAIGNGSRGGDKIKISDNRGNVTNVDSSSRSLKTETRNQAESLLRMLMEKTGWVYTPAHWHWGPYRVCHFNKGNIKPGKARCNELMLKNPLSLAMISGLDIEYTLDEENIF